MDTPTYLLRRPAVSPLPDLKTAAGIRCNMIGSFLNTICSSTACKGRRDESLEELDSAVKKVNKEVSIPVPMPSSDDLGVVDTSEAASLQPAPILNNLNMTSSSSSSMACKRGREQPLEELYSVAAKKLKREMPSSSDLGVLKAANLEHVPEGEDRKALLDNILRLLLMKGLRNRDEEAGYLIRAINKLVPRLGGREVLDFVPKILAVTLPLLIDEDERWTPHPYSQDGRLVIANTSKAAGACYQGMVMLLLDGLDDKSKYVQEAAAKALAVMSCALGLSGPDLRSFIPRDRFMGSRRMTRAFFQVSMHERVYGPPRQPTYNDDGDDDGDEDDDYEPMIALRQAHGSLLENILDLLLIMRGQRNRDTDRVVRPLVAAISRVLPKLELPNLTWRRAYDFLPKILAVSLHLLMDEDDGDPNCKEGRQLIANTCIAVGEDYGFMAIMLFDYMEHESEYVREAAAKAFAVMTCTLGAPAMLQRIQEVCLCRHRSWRGHHASIQMVGHVAILMGCALGSNILQLVFHIVHGLGHKDLTIVRMTAASLTSLAQAAAPYGFIYLLPAWNYFTSFDGISDQLGLRHRKGEVLVELLRLFDSIYSLIDFDYPIDVNLVEARVAALVAVEKAISMLKEHPEEKSKEVALSVLKQWFRSSPINAGVVLPANLFLNMWGRTMIFGRNNYKMLVDVTIDIANKFGTAELRRRLVEDLKDHSELYRLMVIKTVEKALAYRDASDGDQHLEEVFEDIDYLFLSSF